MIYGTHMEAKRTHGSGIGTDPAQDTQDHIKLIVCIIHSPHGCRTCPGAVWSRTNFVQNSPGTVRIRHGWISTSYRNTWECVLICVIISNRNCKKGSREQAGACQYWAADVKMESVINKCMDVVWWIHENQKPFMMIFVNPHGS